MTAAITVARLAKRYATKEAVKELTFSVEQGSIYGLIGANGAGKTTTLSILAGLLRPTSGEVAILGVPVTTENKILAKRVGFYSAHFSFLDYLTGREILSTQGRLQGLTRDGVERRSRDLLALFDLVEAADHYVYEYSQGMRQKLGLACALIHAPEVLLLDEPFDGLDPTSVYRLVETLRAVARRQKTILLTSHDLALVERVCNRVGILHDGRIEREVELGSAEKSAGVPRSAGSLESLLWGVVGNPRYEELTWL